MTETERARDRQIESERERERDEYEGEGQSCSQAKGKPVKLGKLYRKECVPVCVFESVSRKRALGIELETIDSWHI